MSGSHDSEQWKAIWRIRLRIYARPEAGAFRNSGWWFAAHMALPFPANPHTTTSPRGVGFSVVFCRSLLGDVYIFINSGSFRYKSTFLCAVKVCVKIRCWFIDRFAVFVFYIFAAYHVRSLWFFKNSYSNLVSPPVRGAGARTRIHRLTHICCGGFLSALKTCILHARECSPGDRKHADPVTSCNYNIGPSAVAISWVATLQDTLGSHSAGTEESLIGYLPIAYLLPDLWRIKCHKYIIIIHLKVVM